jgi:hypothetical protein
MFVMGIEEEPKVTVTIRDAGNMSDHLRQYIADWLRRTASDLERNGGEYSKLFRARFFDDP